jgi:hypothetical protein
MVSFSLVHEPIGKFIDYAMIPNWHNLKFGPHGHETYTATVQPGFISALW